MCSVGHRRSQEDECFKTPPLVAKPSVGISRSCSVGNEKEHKDDDARMMIMSATTGRTEEIDSTGTRRRSAGWKIVRSPNELLRATNRLIHALHSTGQHDNPSERDTKCLLDDMKEQQMERRGDKQHEEDHENVHK